MRILRSYILEEFIGPLILSIFTFTFVMLLGNLVKIANLVINRGVNIFTVFKLFLFMAPSLFTYTLPISTLAAILLSLGRFTHDNEIVTLKASGINTNRLLSPLIIVSIILSLLLVIFNDKLIPYAHFETRKTLTEVGLKNPTAILEPGIFINSFDKYTIFIYSIDDNKLNNIRIYEPQGDNKPTRVIVAKRGEFQPFPEKNMIKLKLEDGTTDEQDPNNPNNFYKLNFKTYFMSLNLTQMQDKNKMEKKPSDMTIKELIEESHSLKKKNIDATPTILKINEKIALSFACFVFVLFGIPLAIITKRREKTINFGIALLVVGIYYLLFIGSEALSLQGYINPYLALWIPNILFGIIGASLTFKVCAY